MYLYFPVVIMTTSQPARQTTGTFFSSRNRQNQKLTQQHNPPDRQLELFFPVVIKLSRHNKKTADFPPEPITDTTAHVKRGQVPPAHAKRVFLTLCQSVRLSVRKG